MDAVDITGLEGLATGFAIEVIKWLCRDQLDKRMILMHRELKILLIVVPVGYIISIRQKIVLLKYSYKVASGHGTFEWSSVY